MSTYKIATRITPKWESCIAKLMINLSEDWTKRIEDEERFLYLKWTKLADLEDNIKTPFQLIQGSW